MGCCWLWLVGGKRVNSLSIEPVLRDRLLLAELSQCHAARLHPGKAVESWAGAEEIHRVRDPMRFGPFVPANGRQEEVGSPSVALWEGGSEHSGERKVT